MKTPGQLFHEAQFTYCNIPFPKWETLDEMTQATIERRAQVFLESMTPSDGKFKKPHAANFTPNRNIVTEFDEFRRVRLAADLPADQQEGAWETFLSGASALGALIMEAGSFDKARAILSHLQAQMDAFKAANAIKNIR